jgi:leader peptidase (prepilin peptidase)/N-methyltransferase
MAFDYAEFSAEFPWFFPLAAFFFGACVGSFLNVVIYRVPKEESVVTPGSHCGCGRPIAWYDNIPILSWLLLRGQARCCGRKFSFRYPAVELLTALLFVATWLKYPPAVAACGWVFLACLIAATFIDLDHMIIPDVFTIGLGIVGVLLSVLVPALHNQQHELFAVASMRAGLASLQGLLVGSALVLWILILAEAILKKEAMGFGDVKFVGAIGAFCGWQGAVFALFGGALVGTVWFAIAKLADAALGRKNPEPPAELEPESLDRSGFGTGLAFGTHVPFGPMLAIAGALYFLAFREAVLAWLADVSPLF